MSLLSFEDVYAWLIDNGSRAADKRPYVLLGNGFSISFDNKRYSYKAILDRAEGKLSELSYSPKIFQDLGSEDFEKVIFKLEDIAGGLEVIDPIKYKEEISGLRYESSRVKQILAESIADLHNDRPFSVAESSYELCRLFINKFKAYYTTNYDFLLYWVCMHDTEMEDTGILATDGFYDRDVDADYVVWDDLGSKTQTLFYLHGALHLFKDKTDGTIRKITYSRTKSALIEQTRKQLDAGRYPLVVAEGSAESKKKRVSESAYLSHCHRSLASRGGALLVYGLSFSDNDSHIGDAIARSTISKIAVSVYGNPDSPENRKVRDSVDKIVEKRNKKGEKKNSYKRLEVRYFDASTADIW